MAEAQPNPPQNSEQKAQQPPPPPPPEPRQAPRREKNLPPERAASDPAMEGRKQIENKEKEIIERDFQKSNRNELDDLQKAELKGKMTAEISDDLKSEMQVRSAQAKEVRDNIDVMGGMTREDYATADNVWQTVAAASRAMELGYIDPPTHEATRNVFDSLAASLRNHQFKEVSLYLHPLINGVLNESEYISFSPGEGLSTKFERDLMEMMNNRSDQRVETYLSDLFRNLIRQGKLTGITNDEFLAKIAKAKSEKAAYAKDKRDELIEQQKAMEKRDERRNRRSEELDKQITERLTQYEQQGGQQGKEAEEARLLYDSLNTANDFFKFYGDRFNEQRDELVREQGFASLDEITDPNMREGLIEAAAKRTTEKIQRLMLFTTHVIFSPALEGDPSKNWQELMRETSGAYGINLESIFNNFKNKFIYLMGQTTTLPGEIEGKGIPFYNFGLTEEEIFMPDTNELQGGKIVRKSVPTAELTKMDTFKEFIERLHVSLDTEHNLLVAGINYNYLLMTGRTEANTSFFQQATRYAQQTLPSHRIDELYHLPYHELVHAAKIQLSSYFKKQFAMNDWMKDPALFYAAFDHSNKVSREALLDMIRNFADEKTPEWAIRRAFFHARMHMSLISQEWHSYAGYGHPNLTEDFQPTYTDPALKNLETYRTWFPAEQWQVGDAFIQTMAFMPQPNRQMRFNEWDHEEVAAEGKDIYYNISHIGNMALVNRKYFDQDSPPNILEFNPLKAGGLEQQGGWRFKYPAAPWVFDMINHTGQQSEKLILDTDTETKTVNDHRNLEFAWKRLENLGVDVMKMYRDAWLTGGGDYLELDGDKTEYDEEWKNLFGFLYRRYFSDPEWKKAFTMSFDDENLTTHKINFADINSEQEFWDKLVVKILHRKPVQAQGETTSEAKARNNKEREGYIKQIVDHALTVMAFERLPMDFVFMENPTRSQNGVTLIKELQQQFIHTDPKVDQRQNAKEVKEFQDAIDDILYAQERARAVSIEQMNQFVKDQDINARTGGLPERQRTIYGKNLDSTKSDFSDVALSAEHPEVKGYRLTEEVIRSFLIEKYKRDPAYKQYVNGNGGSLPPEANTAIEKALELYRTTRKKIVDKPTENRLLTEEGIDSIVSDSRIKRHMEQDKLNANNKKEFEAYKVQFRNNMIQKFKQAREDLITSRAMWSEKELLSGQLGIGMNDVAYPFLTFSSVGPDMVARTIEQIAGTQEVLFKKISGGEILSALKKYYRKEDKEEFFKIVNDTRTELKNWLGPEEYNGTAMRLVENAMNVLRINSDAESPVVEMAYKFNHKQLTGFSKVVKEGEEHPLRREDRYQFVEEFLNYAQFEKRANPEERVYEKVEQWTFKGWVEDKESFMYRIADMADKIFGRKEGNLVRQKWKELSGEGLRDREFARLYDIFVKYGGGTYLALAVLAFMAILVKEGFEQAND